MKRGRKEKSFVTQEGTIIQGLRRTVDGRWRYFTPEGREVKFSEADEKLAVRRFQQATAKAAPSVVIPVAKMSLDELTSEGPSLNRDMFAESIEAGEDEEGNFTFGHKVNIAAIWEWCRAQIVDDPVHAAKMLRLPGIARLDFNTPPGEPIPLTKLVDLYDAKSGSNQNTRGHVRSAVRRLIDITNVETVPQLTTPALMAFRDRINEELQPSGAQALFGKVKAALAFARKVGLDADQIDAALGRCKVLYAPRADTQHAPKPITKAEFDALLAAADARWRATLLVSLNMALYLVDVSLLRWEEFDLDARTYTGKRNKTRIVRVGWLWEESVAALKALPRSGSPFVFPSSHGKNYRSDSLHRQYAAFRETARVTAPFSSIRDGAYSVAARSVDDRTARIFAAHASHGLMDAYVSRNPELVKPAAEAVRNAYGPFPAE